MRIALCSILLLLVAGATSASENYRPATVNEIMKQLPKLSRMSSDGNGYLYANGSNTRYKVSKGEICVRPKGMREDCVRVEFNGETLRMLDSRGNIDRLN
jgi:hypothetical protein